MTDHWHSSPVRPRWKHIWMHGFVIGVVVMLIGFLAWFLLTDEPSSSNAPPGETPPPVQTPQQQAPPGPSAPGQPPAAPKAQVDAAAELRNQLARVLTGIKEANQKKDLSRLLSYYSPNFSQLPQRAQQIAKTWKIYDYPKMDFRLEEVKILADQTAVARVTWDVETHNITTGKDKSVTKRYLIKFARESGQWRIKALDPAD
jgi:ketosteroid isomerase-like protein